MGGVFVLCFCYTCKFSFKTLKFRICYCIALIKSEMNGFYSCCFDAEGYHDIR